MGIYGYDIESKSQSSRFATIEDIREKSKEEPLAIPKIVFQKGFDDWKKRWYKYIISEAGYIEGYKTVIDK